MELTVTYIGGALDGQTEVFATVPDSEAWRADCITGDRQCYLLYLFDLGGHVPTLAYVHHGLPVEAAEARLAQHLQSAMPSAPVAWVGSVGTAVAAK